jgi:membrane fusion protein, copper/silver efflux system
MCKKLSGLLLISAAFLAGYGYGRWYAKPPTVAAKTIQRPLYYRCPMHPSERSDKPGIAPCNMPLEPVYGDDGAAISQLPADVIHVTSQQEQLIGVQFGLAEYAPVSRIMRGAGRVGVNENRVARIQSKLEGYIDRIYVTSPGEHVTQGQLLLSIYNRRTYSMAQMQFLQAAMDATGMSLPATDLTNPNERRLAAAEALRSAHQQLEMMGFTSDQIDAVSRAHQPLYSVPIHAPISGVVLELNAALNQKAGMEPLLTIADLATVWVTATFLGGDTAAIQSGQAASLSVPNLPGKVFHGVVQTILPELDPSTGSTKVLLQFDNAAYLLKPEMYGEVELRSPSAKKLTVPEQAVLDRGRTQAVFVDLGGGYLEPREVRIGERFGDRVEIVQGLKSGQRIVTSGNFLLDSESQLRSWPSGN